MITAPQKILQCPVCDSKLLEPSARKFGVEYALCKSCGIIFSDEIDSNIIITHNDNPEDRAVLEFQKTRLQRITQYLGRRPEKILDFGCGRGSYVNFLNALGFQAVGIDQNTDLKLSDIPAQSIDIVNMVEVIEHLRDANKILQQLTDVLKPDGIIYIESSFMDFIGDPMVSDYVDPRIGHCCIHSKKSIDFLSKRLNMRLTWINNNVVIMHKGQI